MAWKSAKDALFHPTHSPHRLYLSKATDLRCQWHAGHTIPDPDRRSRSRGGSLVASKGGPLLASGEELEPYNEKGPFEGLFTGLDCSF